MSERQRDYILTNDVPEFLAQQTAVEAETPRDSSAGRASGS